LRWRVKYGRQENEDFSLFSDSVFTMCFILTFIIFIAQAILAIKIIQNPEVIGEWIGKIFDGIGG